MRIPAFRLLAAIALGASFAAPAAAQDADPATMMAMQEPVVVGDLAVTQAWARATPPAAMAGAGYLTITNNGAVDDRLVAVQTDVATNPQIHEMAMDSGNMTMRELPDGVVIPAGESVTLQPGGFHLMLIGLDEAGLVQGTIVKVTLVFEVAGSVDVDLVVYPIGSDGPAGEDGGMGGM